MEKSCKNCKWFRQFAEENIAKYWFTCVSCGIDYFSTIPCRHHKFATEADAPTWQPKNPDEYEPGCRNEGCEFHNKDCHCLCELRPRRHSKESHRALCNRLPCYDPPPKPKTRRIISIEWEVNKRPTEQVMKIVKHFIELSASPNYVAGSKSGIHCEIREEEV